MACMWFRNALPGSKDFNDSLPCHSSQEIIIIVHSNKVALNVNEISLIFHSAFNITVLNIMQTVSIADIHYALIFFLLSFFWWYRRVYWDWKGNYTSECTGITTVSRVSLFKLSANICLTIWIKLIYYYLIFKCLYSFYSLALLSMPGTLLSWIKIWWSKETRRVV